MVCSNTLCYRTFIIIELYHAPQIPEVRMNRRNLRLSMGLQVTRTYFQREIVIMGGLKDIRVSLIGVILLWYEIGVGFSKLSRKGICGVIFTVKIVN